MNKKILSIIFSLFLVGVFSISCSSKEDPKGIEQYNGNIYVSKDKGTTVFPVYLWISVKDGKIAFASGNDSTTIPEKEFNDNTRYLEVEGSGSKYTVKGLTAEFREFTLEFSEDGSTVNATIGIVSEEGTPYTEKFECTKKN